MANVSVSGSGFDIKVDTKAADAYLQGFIVNVPKALAIALNRTAEEGNAALRAQLPKSFHMRVPSFLRHIAPQQLPKPQRATPETLWATVKTDAAGHILDPFETGEPKTQKSSLSPVAIPTRDIRFTPDTLVPARWYPHNLGLTPRRDPTGKTYYALGRGSIGKRKTPLHRTAGGSWQIKGKSRTFVLDPQFNKGLSDKQRGVYVRIGPSRGDIRMIWRYTERVPRPRNLHFFDTINRTVNERWTPNMIGALEQFAGRGIRE
jgi:hypothetical protein